MDPKHLTAMDVEGTRRWNDMAQRELLDAQRFTAGEHALDTDLREKAWRLDGGSGAVFFQYILLILEGLNGAAWSGR